MNKDFQKVDYKVSSKEATVEPVFTTDPDHRLRFRATEIDDQSDNL